MQQAILAAGALAGALLGIVALGEKVADLLRDDDPAPTPIASVDAVTLRDRNVTRADYCREHLDGAQREACLSGPGLEDAGNLFLVTVRTDGYDGPCCRLEWTIRENGTKLPRFSDKLALRDIPSPDERNWPIWVPNPGREGDFHVVFDLYDARGHRSAKPSESFSVVDPG